MLRLIEEYREWQRIRCGNVAHVFECWQRRLRAHSLGGDNAEQREHADLLQ